MASSVDLSSAPFASSAACCCRTSTLPEEPFAIFLMSVAAFVRSLDVFCSKSAWAFSLDSRPFSCSAASSMALATALSWSIIALKTPAVALACFSQNSSDFVEFTNLPSFAIVSILPSSFALASIVESSAPLMSADMSVKLSAWPSSFFASASRSSALAVSAAAVSFSFPATASVSFAWFTSESLCSHFLPALAMSASARFFALLAPVSWSFAIALMESAPPPVASFSIFLALARSSSACAFKSFAAFSSSAASALTVFADSCSVFALGTMPSTWETSFLAAPIFVSSMLTTWSADFLMVSAAAAAAFSSATSRL
mmetsp:Transcript_33858/g.86777  ORF Transcript_33858/g.86777 Transcript_33858/m.86777 type:complete len:315 (+) Transcript_33858:765-1709(+)